MAIAYYDNALVDRKDIAVSPADFGFNRGLAIFELVRVYGGVPFRLDDHLARLQGGAAALGLTLPVSLSDLAGIVERLCAANEFPHSALKFYFTAGESRAALSGLGGDHDFAPHLMIFEDMVRPAHSEAPYGLDAYRRGQRLKIVPCERALPSIKSTGYMQGFIALQAAGSEWDDILFTHRDGYITEVTRANFFCVVDGVLCTPDKDMLHGITRKVILEIAADLNLQVTQRSLFPADLMRASEAFTTGSIAELMPVRQIDDHILPTTMEGQVFSAVRRQFSARLPQARENGGVTRARRA